jgi:hypothetical protein
MRTDSIGHGVRLGPQLARGVADAVEFDDASLPDSRWIISTSPFTVSAATVGAFTRCPASFIRNKLARTRSRVGGRAPDPTEILVQRAVRAAASISMWGCSHIVS